MSDMRVLVVEDDGTYRDLLITALGVHGCESRGAENGARALEVLTRWQPDVILLDMLMPVMDGLRFLEELGKTESAGTPAVVLTCMESRSLVVDAVMAGASEVLLKPAPFDTLLAKLKQVARKEAAEVTKTTT